MADFTGLTVRVTLKEPPNFVLEGKVWQVVPGQTLSLQNVFFPHNGSRAESWTVHGPAIQDLQVVNTNTDAPPAPTPTSAIRTTAPPMPTTGPPQGLGRPTHATGPPSHPQQQHPIRRPDPTAWTAAAERLPNEFMSEAEAAGRKREDTAPSTNAPPQETINETWRRTTAAQPRLGAPRKFEKTEYTVYDAERPRPGMMGGSVPLHPGPGSVAPAANPPPQGAPTSMPPATNPSIRAVSEQTQRQPSNFVDPAILSYGRSQVQTKTASKPPEPSTPIKSMLSKAAETLPSTGSPFVAEAGKSSSSRKASQSKAIAQQEPGARQSLTVQTQNVEPDGTQEVVQADAVPKKKARRTQKKKATNATSTSQDPPPVMNAEVSRNGNDMNGSVKRGKGWRQTPLLQPSPQTSSPQNGGSGSVKKSRKQQQQESEAQENGWATEEATEIHDLGDFDFEANHKLFDKKQVFDELRQGDTTADDDRLVSHNKVHRPGTYSGKNLHPTENVLSPQLGPNELDSTSDADTELNLHNGRSSSRHSSARVSMKKQPSRQNSAQVEGKPHPLTASMSSDRADRPTNRSVTSLSGRHGKPVPSLTTSPLPDRTQSPHSAVSAAKSHAMPTVPSQVSEAHLAIHPGMTPCPVLHPTALGTLEKETVARYGLTHDAITESAARCIAEMAMSLSSSTSGSRRGSRANTLRSNTNLGLGIERSPSQNPVIVIIAGNHAIGARAVAAARHLVCRKTTIIVAEAQFESSESQDSQLKSQISILRRMVKTGASIKRGPWRRAWGYIKNLPAPPAVIIDALLAGSTYESMLEESPNRQHAEEAQRETRDMIDWANRSRAPVLSVGCPSGVSGLDGSTTTIEGEPLAVRPDKVLCLAAPMQGILDAMEGGERWDVSLADIGINIALRSEEAVAFGANWVTEVKFVEDGEKSIEVQQ